MVLFAGAGPQETAALRQAFAVAGVHTVVMAVNPEAVLKESLLLMGLVERHTGMISAVLGHKDLAVHRQDSVVMTPPIAVRAASLAVPRLTGHVGSRMAAQAVLVSRWENVAPQVASVGTQRLSAGPAVNRGRV